MSILKTIKLNGCMIRNHNIWNYLYFTYYLCTRGDFHALFCAFIFKCATVLHRKKRFCGFIMSLDFIKAYPSQYYCSLKKIFGNTFRSLNLKSDHGCLYTDVLTWDGFQLFLSIVLQEIYNCISFFVVIVVVWDSI